jgi:hypothetical protein
MRLAAAAVAALALAALAAGGSAAAPAAGCAGGWRRFRGGCYARIAAEAGAGGARGWTSEEARAACAARGAALAAPANALEDAWVRRVVAAGWEAWAGGDGACQLVDSSGRWGEVEDCVTRLAQSAVCRSSAAAARAGAGAGAGADPAAVAERRLYSSVLAGPGNTSTGKPSMAQPPSSPSAAPTQPSGSSAPSSARPSAAPVVPTAPTPAADTVAPSASNPLPPTLQPSLATTSAPETQTKGGDTGVLVGVSLAALLMMGIGAGLLIAMYERRWSGESVTIAGGPRPARKRAAFPFGSFADSEGEEGEEGEVAYNKADSDGSSKGSVRKTKASVRPSGAASSFRVFPSVAGSSAATAAAAAASILPRVTGSSAAAAAAVSAADIEEALAETKAELEREKRETQKAKLRAEYYARAAAKEAEALAVFGAPAPHRTTVTPSSVVLDEIERAENERAWDEVAAKVRDNSPTQQPQPQSPQVQSPQPQSPQPQPQPQQKQKQKQQQQQQQHAKKGSAAVVPRDGMAKATRGEPDATLAPAQGSAEPAGSGNAESAIREARQARAGPKRISETLDPEFWRRFQRAPKARRNKAAAPASEPEPGEGGPEPARPVKRKGLAPAADLARAKELVLQAKRQAKERKKARQASLKDNYSTLSSRRSSGVPGQGPDEPQPESPPPSKGDATLARERVLGRSIAAELSSVLAGSSSSSKSGSGSKSGSKSGSGSKSAPRLPPSLPPRRGSTPHSEASSSDTEQPQRKPQAGDHARKPRREAQLEDDSTEPPQAAPEQGQLEAAEQMTPLLPPVSRFSLSHLAVTLRGPLARAGAASDAETAATASDDASTVSGLSKARVKSFQGLDLEPGQPRGDLRVTLNIEPTSRPLYAQQLKDASLARIADEAAAAAVAKASRRDA